MQLGPLAADEQLLTLVEATTALPRRIHLSTIRRWYLLGVRGQKLETAMIAGRRYTSREALERFVAAISNPKQTAGEARRPCTPSPRARKDGVAEPF